MGEDSKWDEQKKDRKKGGTIFYIFRVSRHVRVALFCNPYAPWYMTKYIPSTCCVPVCLMLGHAKEKNSQRTAVPATHEGRTHRLVGSELSGPNFLQNRTTGIGRGEGGSGSFTQAKGWSPREERPR